MEKTVHSAVNVEVIDEAFYMPQLDRHRRVWIYKPTGYYQTDKRYPVIYMHDGQNLFDEAVAFGQEWGIDETLNTLLAECIIVGIDNSEHRMTEYNLTITLNLVQAKGRSISNLSFIRLSLPST